MALQKVLEEDDEDLKDEESKSEESEDVSEGSSESIVYEVEPEEVYDKFVQGKSPSPSVIQKSKVDYDAIFSYLSERRTQSMYDDVGDDNELIVVEELPAKLFDLDPETIRSEMVIVKYFISGELMGNSPIPQGDMSPEDFERYKMYWLLFPAEAKLRMDIA